MQDLVDAFPALPLLLLVATVAVFSRPARRYAIGVYLGIVATIVIGVFARQALAPVIGVCRTDGIVRVIPAGPASDGSISRSAR
jgi:hypothetical protein